ncbi:Glutamate receptor ionotropic like protein [Argiope bruennichi]|uniref:Glutamate receptor ionotropic like protein n=1 Tax=Argiope bruennichi TaxID=94029 RepID=A0A8T0DZJ1_ARGBR|nr:Glutamate receptor ionotropic like protein [Argiope bruennichi]
MKFPKFLRIAVNELGAICELGVDSNGKVKLIGGAEREFLKALTEVFNFRYELVQPPDTNWGNPLPGGNWTGMVGMIQRGEADMALCSMVITQYREEIVTFTREYDIQHMVFATKNPENLPRLRSIILPFSPQMWFGVLCLLIIIPIVWKRLLELQEDIGKFYMYVLASLLKLSVVIKCRGKWGHYMLLGSWFWGVAVISAGYSAVLLSFVTLPVKEDVIRDIPRLANAVAKGTHKCYAFKGLHLLMRCSLVI